jgi:site-specific recombinase XerD
VPRIPRRDVIYLTKEEVQRYVEAIIAPDEPWDAVPLMRLRFRALVEVLLGTGARISEGLSCNRSDIQWECQEAKIIGKGNQECCVMGVAEFRKISLLVDAAPNA